MTKPSPKIKAAKTAPKKPLKAAGKPPIKAKPAPKAAAPKAAPKAASKPAPKAVAKPLKAAPKAAAKPAPKAALKAAPKATPKAVAKPAPKAAPKAAAKPVAKAAAKPAPKAAAPSKPVKATAPKLDVKPEAPKAEAKTKLAEKPKAAPKVEAKIEAKPDVKVDAKAEAKPAPKAEKAEKVVAVRRSLVPVWENRPEPGTELRPIPRPPVAKPQEEIKLTPSAATPINLSNANIRIEKPTDTAGIKALLGTPAPLPAGALPRATDILREGVEPISDLCFVGEDKGSIVGTLRFWPVLIGPVTTALLLGPLAVHSGWHSRGLAAQLINLALGRARDLGHKIVLVVGDPSYYSRFGFSRLVTQSLLMPSPVELEKFLGIELIPGAMQGVNGEVRPITAMPPGALGPEHHTPSVLPRGYR